MRISAKAMAKINLYLSVTGKRADGYHLLESVMQSVNIFDTVTISDTNRPDEISVSLSGLKIPLSCENIAEKAARQFFKYTNIPNPGISININKKIPAAAGLGGGSADAAAVLTLLGTALGGDLELPELLKIAETVGADVPFCLIGGTALAEGIGELLTPLPLISGGWFVIVKAGEKVSTAEMYRRLDEFGVYEISRVREFTDTVCRADLPRMGSLLHNDFAALSETEQSKQARAIMNLCSPLGVSLSGSGPSLFALFDEKNTAEKCAIELKQLFHEVFLCEAAGAGVIL